MRPAAGEPVMAMLIGEFGSTKPTVFAGLTTPPADAVTETVCGAATPLRVALATPFVVVVIAESVPADVVNVTTVPSAMLPPGPPVPLVPAGVTVAVSTTLVLILAVAAPLTVIESGAFGSIKVTDTDLAGSEPTVAVTVKSPLAALDRVAVATPPALVVVTAESVPPVVAKATAVPVATGEPSALRTVAEIVTGVLTRADAVVEETVSVAGALVSTGIPPPPPPQPAKVNNTRDINRQDRFLALMSFLAFFENVLNLFKRQFR